MDVQDELLKRMRAGGGRQPAEELRLMADIRAAGLFDAAYYLESNPDVAASGMDPLLHYIRYGHREGRRTRALTSARGGHHPTPTFKPIRPAGPDDRRVILILGMHRSGTSCLTRMLHIAGVPLGGPLLLENRPDNPDGYWEHEQVTRTHDGLLKQLDRVINSPNGLLSLPQEWLLWPETASARERLLTVVRRETEASTVWAVKDPRTMRFLTLWWDILGKLRQPVQTILCLRNPDEVACSMSARGLYPRAWTHQLWRRSHLELLRDLPGGPDAIVRYDELLANPGAILRMISDKLLLRFDPIMTKQAAATILQDRRHHQLPIPEDAEGKTAGILYRQLCEWAAGDTLPPLPPDRQLPGPKVSIVMRTCDRPLFLPRALRSVLGQTYSNWELLVVNSGSREAVETAVAPYRMALKDRLVVIHLTPGCSIQAASNAAIARSSGERLVVHDDDDSWLPRFLEAGIAHLAANGCEGVVCRSILAWERIEDGVIIQEREEPFKPELNGIHLQELLRANLFPPISFLFTRKAIDSVGSFREDYISLGDYEFNIRFLRRFQIGFIDEPLARWHRRDPVGGHPNFHSVVPGNWRLRIRDNLLREVTTPADAAFALLPAMTLLLDDRLEALAHRLIRATPAPAPQPRKRLSVLVLFHEMRREAVRTLWTLTPAYQQGVRADEYEVIVLDNSAHQPLNEAFVETFGSNFRLVRMPVHPSPAEALNHGLELAVGEIVLSCIDGARMLSPGILAATLRAAKSFENPFIHTIGLHLGPDLQNRSLSNGYGREVEDKLLESIDWRTDGYRLFSISSPAGSTTCGFFGSITESNCFALRRDTFLGLGGYDRSFISPGGGLLNLHLYNRIMETHSITPVRLLGEATFHQFHGGVSTNVEMESHPFADYAAEYQRVVGRPYAASRRGCVYFGEIAPSARWLAEAEEAITIRRRGGRPAKPGTPRRPDFIGIGAQRSGTTWLYRNLGLHPAVWMPPLKEIHYFDQLHGEERDLGPKMRLRYLQANLGKWNAELASGASIDAIRHKLRWASRLTDSLDVDDEWYGRLFEEALPGQVAGEITPAYAVLPEEGVAHAKALNPDLRILFMMRHPVERMISGAIHQLTTASGTLDVPRIEDILTEMETGRCRSRSGYRQTIENWERHFSREQIGYLFFDDLQDDPSKVLQHACRHLGVAWQEGIFPAVRERCNGNVDCPDELVRAAWETGRRFCADDLCWLAERFPDQAPSAWLL